jgi:tetratricopeptide (TPR) repeat protein
LYLDSAFRSAGELVENLQPSAAVYIERGLAYSKKQSYESALTEFNNALKIEPKNAAALYYIGDVYYYQDEYDNAISYYT